MKTADLTVILHKLERRCSRLQATSELGFHPMLRRFWGFLCSHSVILGVMADLIRRHPDADGVASSILQSTCKDSKNRPFACDEDFAAAIGCAVVEQCVRSPDNEIEDKVGELYADLRNEEDTNLGQFNHNFIQPLCDYLYEHLDDQRSLLSLLRRYKHRCEWFRRRRYDLLDLSAKGERALAEDLYEYLHDQGIDFAIEPTSASGKPDLISDQIGSERLVADAKVFGDCTPKTYLAKGFHQIYQYTLDYNQPFGYLVIFKTCEDNLKFPMANQEQSIPFFVLNNKTIFFVVIDICQHEATASKRGVLKTIEITEADLIQNAEMNKAVTDCPVFS